MRERINNLYVEAMSRKDAVRKISKIMDELSFIDRVEAIKIIKYNYDLN